MCGNIHMRRERGNIDVGVVSDVVKELHEWSVKPTVLFHTIGEPMLHPEIHDIVTRFLAEAIPVHLYTNGTLPHLKLFADVLKCPGCALTFSAGHLHSDLLTQRLTHIKNTCDRVNFCETAGKVRVRIVVDDCTRQQDALRMRLVYQQLACFPVSVEVASEGNQGGHNPRQRNHDIGFNSRPCDLPFRTLVVSNTGGLGYCVVDFENDLVSSWQVRDGLARFWNSEFMAEIRSQHHSGKGLQETPCQFCSCRKASWEHFPSIYRERY